jgi:hypothetical protein
VKFYLLDSLLRPSEYAMFSHLGTWETSETCPACDSTRGRLIEPLLVEWNIGTTRIGDFSWRGYTCIVTDRVRDCLIKHGFPCRFGEVQYVAPEKARGFSRRELKQYGRVPFPYTGPHLSWLIATATVPADIERSRLKVKERCDVCGIVRYSWRRDDLHLVVPAASYSGEKMFTLTQFMTPSIKYVTEEGLAILKGAGFTNFIVRDAGEIIP